MPHHTRYIFPVSNGDADYSRLICRDCSTRTTGVQIPADEQAEHDAWHDLTRHAVIRGYGHDRLEKVRRYLPANSVADSDVGSIFIHGYDNAGWGLDTYVIPRLASGLHFAVEV